MVKALAFKGDKKSRKRKAPHPDVDLVQNSDPNAVTMQSTTAEGEEDDNWVTADAATDITGPIVFALPSATPTCIACDANGKVYASEIENIIERDLATAEPHDVRQVWVANRVAGTEEISFKGHHGRCDKIGLLSATREAISPEESFLCIPSPETPGTFSVQTVRERFLTVVDETKIPEIRGDAESVSFNTTLRIRMQARFKPRLKANKALKIKEKISRKELEEVVGRRLEDNEGESFRSHYYPLCGFLCSIVLAESSTYQIDLFGYGT
ncbi:protein FRG1, partial [Lecanoromycetidae sp. Uapishka_2]